MLPLLRLLQNQQPWRIRDTVEALATEFHLNAEDLATMLPSGRAPLFYNRLAWARTHMSKAGLIESPTRGFVQITQSGLSLLGENPDRVSLKTLERYPAFLEFRNRENTEASGTAVSPTPAANDEKISPQEQLEQSHLTLVDALISDLVESLKSVTPLRFEQIVVDVITAMGYGGSRQEAGKAIGRSGDEGIDGIINEDRLGLDTIYLQAKRWENPVGRPEIQKFVGALAGQQAHKGIFITTSSFTKEAEDYARKITQKVILISGPQLARLMIEHNVGVSVVATYALKKLDSDYFTEE